MKAEIALVMGMIIGCASGGESNQEESPVFTNVPAQRADQDKPNPDTNPEVQSTENESPGGVGSATDHTNEDVASYRSGKVLVVASGGYMSCGLRRSPASMVMIDEADELIARLEQEGHEVEKVISCFRVDGLSDTTLMMHPSWGDEQVSDETGFVQQVKSRVAGNAFQKIYIVGHSWGGTLAFTLAEALAGSSAEINLATIDAIDYEHCHPPLREILDNAECKKVAKRLRDRGQALNAQINSWNHFYQTRDRTLQSGNLGFLSHSEEISYRIALGSHARIATSSEVWDQIYQQFGL